MPSDVSGVRGKWGKNISLIQNGVTQYITFLFQCYHLIMKEYEIIMLKYNGNACRLYLLCFGEPDNIVISASRPGSTKFEGKHVWVKVTCVTTFGHKLPHKFMVRCTASTKVANIHSEADGGSVERGIIALQAWYCISI